MSRIAPRTVDVIAGSLRRQILDGELSAGDRLPAERKLAASFGVSRLTLRAAIAALESEGLVVPRQGHGVVVLDYRQTAGVGVLPHLMNAEGLALLEPFLTLRRALGSEAAALASVRATEADLDRLQCLADDIEAGAIPLTEGNLVFARALVELSGNLPIQLLFNTVAAIYERRPELSARLVEEGPVLQSFPAILALLRTRDPDRVRDGVRRLLTVLDHATLEALR